jgi:C1A family cysteine protease
MRYSVNILLGSELLDTAKDLKKYALKYGVDSLTPYFNCFSWVQSSDVDVAISKIEQVTEQSKFVSGLNDAYTVQLKTVRFLTADKTETIAQFFDSLYASIMTTGNTADYRQLHICLFVQLYEEEYWQQAKFIIELLKSLPNRYFHIDVVGLNYDLQSAITGTANIDDAKLKKQRVKTSKKTISEIVKYRKEKQDSIFHFILMQNTQEGGIALNLNPDAFVRILAEFSLLCVEHYKDIFGTAVPETDLQAFGLSVLHFDCYYFIEYLLHKAYIHAMEREGVNVEEVDINAIFNKSEEILNPRINLLSDFFNDEVLPRLDKNENEQDIVEEMCPKLDTLLEDLQHECDKNINDKSLSIPFKRAIFSALLGYDDELFKNTIFKDDTPILDDLDSEAMDIYINANNSLLPETEKEDDTYTDEEKQSLADAILSKNKEKINNPLKEMKKLHTEMQRRMGYIRDLEKETQQLETQIGNIGESKKSLIEGDFFVFGDHKFRLLPNIEEVPLKEDYAAHTPKEKSIDLRENFTEIKNQGELGSCTAHAVTSVFEYILKQNKQEISDLSEAFVYYNARLKAGDTNKDEGSRYDYAIESMTELGICSEELMPYSENDFTTPPSEDAIIDAATRKVKKALNVKLTLNDIKSALEDGYPVAISTKLYDSFGQGLIGIISMPMPEELESTENEENKHRHHAMVICGYDDDKKLFVVRNSWGKTFGDKGYCYMPYMYFTDKKLVSFACVITEVATSTPIVVKNVKVKSRLDFDETDSVIKYAIKKNFLNEENQILKKNQTDYEILRTLYEFLKETLKNPNNQVRLRNARITKLKNNIAKLETEYQAAQNDKYKQLEDFDRYTKRSAITISLISLGVIAVIGLLAYFVGIKVFEWQYTWYAFGGVVAAVLLMIFLYFPIRKHKRRLLEDELDDNLKNLAIKIDEHRRELARTRLNMHISGHYLTKLFDIQTAIAAKHDATSSILCNLKTWHFEELEIIDNFDADTQLPFIPILKNEVLDKYFEQNKEKITEEISLCQHIVYFAEKIKNQAINKEDLITHKKKIKQQCVEHLSKILDGFHIYTALRNPSTYKFLQINNDLLMSVLPKLDSKSKIFVCDNCTAAISPNKLVLINTPTDTDTRSWSNFYPTYFCVQPNSFQLLSPYKVIVFQIAELNENQIN